METSLFQCYNEQLLNIFPYKVKTDESMRKLEI